MFSLARWWASLPISFPLHLALARSPHKWRWPDDIVFDPGSGLRGGREGEARVDEDCRPRSTELDGALCYCLYTKLENAFVLYYVLPTCK